ncbi:MAG: hypothetical protein GXP31_09690 [Kiritimatiellaeota bacterium]|nr:hypothetical protein [Kiritimatiellota bacterium]
MDEARDTMRRLHYSIHAERAYWDLSRGRVHFHGMRGREELEDGARRKIEAFPTHLAVHRDGTPSTQNQVMNGMPFLCRKVLETPLEGIDAARAAKEPRVPVVPIRDGVANVIARLSGVRSESSAAPGSGAGKAVTVRTPRQERDPTRPRQAEMSCGPRPSKGIASAPCPTRPGKPPAVPVSNA